MEEVRLWLWEWPLALVPVSMGIDVVSGALCLFEGVINVTVVCRVPKRTVIKVTLKHRGAAEQA